MTWRIYSIGEEPVSEDIQNIFAEYAGAGTDPWFTNDHDFKDERSAAWYRAIYAIYFNEYHSAFGALVAAGEAPPEEIRPHIEKLYKTRHFVKGKGGRPSVPSILRKSETLLWDDYQLDRATEYAKEHGTTIKNLLEEEDAEAKKTTDKRRKETIQRLISHWVNRWARKG